MILDVRRAGVEERQTYQSLVSVRRDHATATHGDRAYIVYVVVLVVLTVAPSTFAAVDYLLGLWEKQIPTLEMGSLGLVTVAVVLLARMRGPVASSLADIDIVLQAPLDRAAIHGRSLVMWVVGAAVIGAVVASVLGALEHGFDLDRLSVLPIAGAATGLILYAWYLGAQYAASNARRSPWLVLVALTVVTAVAAWLGFPAATPAAWGLLIATLPISAGIRLTLAAMLFVALIVAVLAASRCVARSVPREYLRKQEWTWEATKAGAVNVNPQLISEAVAPERNYGRQLTLANLPKWLHPAAARDLLGAARRWPRMLASLVTAAVGAYLFTTAVGGVIAWLLGAVLLTVAARLSSYGLRTHAANLGRANTLERHSVVSVFAHLAVPTAVSVCGIVVGLFSAWVLGSTPTLGWLCVLLVAAIALLAQGVPAYATQLPVYLIGPIITPVGDLSPLAMSGWLMRIYVLTAAAAWALYNAATLGSVLHVAAWAVFWSALAAALSWQSLRRERASHG